MVGEHRSFIARLGPAVSDAHATTDGSRFTLPPDLAKKVWEHLRAIRIAPPSEKLDAWMRASQLIGGLTGPDFPLKEAADRFWAVAKTDEVLCTYDTNILQAKLAEGFSDPIFPDESDASTEATRPPAFSDEALALRFAELHANDLRYVAAWSKWMAWDGKRWHFDATLRAFDLARKVCRQAAAECNKPKVAACLASAKAVAAVERLARADRRLAAIVDQWDTNPWLLNTPDSVIDLRTGNRRSHSPSDYLTQMTAVAPGGSCPTWQVFLHRVTAGDALLQEFLQRATGYCLTGLTDEHALFFIYGTGANGKSVYINTVAGLLADYHRTAPIETFTASHQDRHPTELARLRSSRLVTAVETEEGRRWAESRIKSLTGGEKIAAHFMRQDFFEFTPQFKLVIAGNHKPGLRSVDEAIRRRFNLIPFTVTIPPAERDLDLAEKLKAEWPGILAWAIEGCSAWQRSGLAAPEAVTAATAAYLESEDAIAAWIEDCCRRDTNRFETTAALFASWTAWTTKTGEHTGTRKRFNQNLEARGDFAPHRTKTARGFYGFALFGSEGDSW
jgi:putative DNA primase/helicase